MAQIVDGNQIAEGILRELAARVALVARECKFTPRLTVFLVGQNLASLSYIAKKQKMGEEIGVAVSLRTLPESADETELLKLVSLENGNPETSGIIVQLPLPREFNRQRVLDLIVTDKDVDCLSTTNFLELAKLEDPQFLPPAAAAILKILDYHQVLLANKNILLVGSGDLVGKPLAALLLRRGFSFRLANRYTPDFEDLTREADVLISGTGAPGLIRGDAVKEGAVVIDAGTTASSEGEIKGDVDFESVKEKASLIAPVPGGVGPVTVAMLLQNVVKSAETRCPQEQI